MTNSTTTTKQTYQWGVFNRETGKMAKTRESNYSRKARFFTRQEARTALREGKVYADSTTGRVSRIDA